MNKNWHVYNDPEQVWAFTYDHTEEADLEGGSTALKALIERPFGEVAVGWRVAVLLEDSAEDPDQ